MWLYILTVISFILLFGFMGISFSKFGVQTCYSDYGDDWGWWYSKLNIWSVVTFISAALLIPVLIEVSSFSSWQFLGFLAPTSLFAVSASPHYRTDKFENIIHQIGAWAAIVCVILYLILIPHLIWIVVPFMFIAFILTMIFDGYFGLDTWMLWDEIAIYLSIYAAIFMMIV